MSFWRIGVGIGIVISVSLKYPFMILDDIRLYAETNQFLSVFPSLLGVQIGNKLGKEAFNKIIEMANEIYNEMGQYKTIIFLSNSAAELQSM